MNQVKNNRGKRRDNVQMNARGNTGYRRDQRVGSDNLLDSPMMARLFDALQAGEDVGEYGRLTFAIVARHFIDEEQLISLLAGQPGFGGEEQARAMLLQVQQRDYNPPKRERILEWQSKQKFQICPEPDDPGGCNLYRELRFPQEIYDRIGEFWEEKDQAEAEED
jgi:hypothetical protein